MGPIHDVFKSSALQRRALSARLLVSSWVRLGIVTLALRWLGFRSVAGWIPAAQQRQISVDDLVRGRRYAAWIDVAARVQPVQARCLARSLTLHWVLRREGVPSELKIGVAKDDGALLAHAWVEMDGTPVNGTRAAVAQFTALAGLGELGGTEAWTEAWTESRHETDRRPDRSRIHAVKVGSGWGAPGCQA